MNPGGYAWWYLDALSDDGAHGLCIIAFIGSVFSPYYAAARRRRAADPREHCAFNVVLSGRHRRWTMTERTRQALRVTPDALVIGPSSLRWDGHAYRFELEERGCPLPRALRGTVRVTPLVEPRVAYALDRAQHHLWTPLAPRARVEVELHAPALHWSGAGYLDGNRGERALEQDFHGWQWSRASSPSATAVYYEPRHRADADWPLALGFAAAGHAPRALELPPRLPLGQSRWRIRGHLRSDAPQSTRLLARTVDAPFYARSLWRTRLDGQPAELVHESLDLDRFARRWVQYLLPFRMPRRRAPAAGAR
ncbi:MAG TPA: hypothetical protein VMT49_09535 [Steroidobacteraceae bacterium]|nr:hypothetical protein [Steroidobacteraceae bacterium]